MANSMYWKLVDTAKEIYNDLDAQGLVFGYFTHKFGGHYFVYDKADAAEKCTFQPISFNKLVESPIAMGELVRYAYFEALEDYKDNAIR